MVSPIPGAHGRAATWRTARGASLVVLALSVGGAAGAEASRRSTPAPYRVGYRVIDLDRGGDPPAPPVTVAVWYPTARAPKRITYGGSTTGRVALDAPPLAGRGRFPLLVFSHGYGGCGLGAVFLTERLAARGWVVAAPDHHDRHSAARIRTGPVRRLDRAGLLRHAREIGSSGPEDRGPLLYRLDELRLVVDRMAGSAPFGKIVDPKRIAVGGHSLGGFTALGLCGTIEARHDERVRALLLFSTGAGGYLYRSSELARVRIPAMVFLGERERRSRRGGRTMAEIADGLFRALAPPKYFLEVRGASHFSFNGRLSDNLGARLLSGTEEELEVIRRYSIAFLETHVAGEERAGRALERGDPKLSRYEARPGPREQTTGRRDE